MLSPAEAAVIRVSAALAARSQERVRAAFREAADAAGAALVGEAVLQSYLFLGYPVALNAFATWREISGRDAPAPSQAVGVDVWTERGAAVCRTVYGGQYERMRANVRRLHPDMEQWMIVEGYGKVLGRPVMALELRELCIVALLAVLDVPKQLYSHLRGALNAGAPPERIEAALSVARRHTVPDVAGRADQVWERVKNRDLVG